MKMNRRSSLALMAILALSAPAAAQDTFPAKPIRIIVPSVAGGGLDLTTRLVAEKMSADLGQPIIVENRPGADAVLGVQTVKDAKPDGYTLITHSGSLILTPLMRSDTGYEPLVDFVGVGRMISYPMVMQVAADKPENTVGQLVAHVRKAGPGQLSFGMSGIGSPSHMAGGMFFLQQGLEVTMVPYKGIAQVFPDVAAGRVYVTADGYNSSQSYINAGTTKALGVTSAERIKPLPNVPTFREQGFDYTYSLWLGMFAPGKTPAPVIARLSKALHAAMASPELVNRFTSEGSTVSLETPEEFATSLRDEQVRMIKVVKDLKLAN